MGVHSRLDMATRRTRIWANITMCRKRIKISHLAALTMLVFCLLELYRTLTPARVKMTFAGSEYGGWWYNAAILGHDSVIYSFGLGEDTSWDEAILQQGMDVYGFDPTPKSIAYVKSRDELRQQAGTFYFTAEGLSDKSGTLTFTMPLDSTHVSLEQGVHEGRGALLQLKVETLYNIMERNGHSHIDLLKLDIESSEYEVLENLLSKRYLPFTQLLVEFHQRFEAIGIARHETLLKALKDSGFRVTHQEGDTEISFQRN